MSTDTNKELDIGSPDTEVSVKKMFGIDSDLMIPAFKKSNDYVPEIDEDYLFNKDTTLAILAGSNTIVVSWFKDIMEQENQHILSKLPLN